MKYSLVGMLIWLFGIQAVWAQSMPVKLATLDWEPYIGEHLKDQGYVAEIVRTAFEVAGNKTEISFLPWARAVKEAEKGEHSGLFPEYYDPSREEKFVYSAPFPGGPVGLYKHKDLKLNYQKLEDIKPYHIGVVRDYINTAEFDAASYLKKEEAVSDEINLKKLFNKRLDLIFIDKFVAQYIISQKFPKYTETLEFVEPPMEVKPLYIAFSKASPEFKTHLEAFNRGLKQMMDSGKVAAIMAKHGFGDKVAGK